MLEDDEAEALFPALVLELSFWALPLIDVRRGSWKERRAVALQPIYQYECAATALDDILRHVIQ